MDTDALRRLRRELLTGAAVLVAGAPLSAPALSQSAVRWTMTSLFSTSLDMIYRGAETCVAAVAEMPEMTDKRFAIEVRPKVAIAPGRRSVSAMPPTRRASSSGLPKAYLAALRAAAALADDQARPRCDAANPEAVRRLVVGRAKLRLFPNEILEACIHTTQDLYAVLGQSDPKFKAIAHSYAAFRSNAYRWWQLAECSFDNFVIRQWRAASL